MAQAPIHPAPATPAETPKVKKRPARRKASTRSKADVIVVLPYQGNWQMWRFPRNSNEILEESAQSLSEIDLPDRCILGIPSEFLYSSPLWLKSTDQTLLIDMLTLQLESRHIGAGVGASGGNFDIIKQTTDRTLVSSAVISPNITEEFTDPRFYRYDLSARFFDYPEDGFYLWRALNRWTLCYAYAGKPVYVQTLTNNQPSTAFAQELNIIGLRLQAERILPSEPTMTIWSEESRTLTIEEVVRKDLAWPVKRTPRPHPRVPQKSWNVMPADMRAAQDRRQRFQMTIKGLMGVIGLYLLVLTGFFAQLGWEYWRVTELETQWNQLKPRSSKVQAAFDQWTALEPAVLPALSPLEIMHQASKHLPKEGVRFRMFDAGDSRVTIEGEARDVSSAMNFVEQLKKNKLLQDYEWGRPRTTVMPNNTTTFSVVGSYRYAQSE